MKDIADEAARRLNAHTNDAAERLRVFMANPTAAHAMGYDDAGDDLDAALAAERRATVERIREAFRKEGMLILDKRHEAILDKEAER